MIKFWDFITWLIHGLDGIKDAIMGSLIYSLYSHFYLKKTVWKNVLAFFTGTVFSIYATPQIVYFFPHFNVGFAGFLAGVIGMKMIEVLIEYDYQVLFSRIVDIFWTPKQAKEVKKEEEKDESKS